MKNHNDGAWLEILILAATIAIAFDGWAQQHGWRVAVLNNFIGLIVLWRQEGRIRDFWRWYFANRELETERAQNVAWTKRAVRDRNLIDMLTAVCRLASRSTEIHFADPGDAVRWSNVIGEYEDYARKHGCSDQPAEKA